MVQNQVFKNLKEMQEGMNNWEFKCYQQGLGRIQLSILSEYLRLFIPVYANRGC